MSINFANESIKRHSLLMDWFGDAPNVFHRVASHPNDLFSPCSMTRCRSFHGIAHDSSLAKPSHSHLMQLCRRFSSLTCSELSYKKNESHLIKEDASIERIHSRNFAPKHVAGKFQTRPTRFHPVKLRFFFFRTPINAMVFKCAAAQCSPERGREFVAS